MDTPIARALSFALVLLLVACAAPPAKSRTDAFLWLRDVDGFNTIDDEHVVLRAGSKAALVKTFGYCDGLRFAETIAIDAPLAYLDERGVGHIVYRRGPFDRGRCAIDRIVAVEDLKEAKAVVAAEKAERAKAKQP